MPPPTTKTRWARHAESRYAGRDFERTWTQYRSVTYCQTSEQRTDAESVVAELGSQGVWRNPIVSEIAGAETFYPAENYHQEYFERNGRQPYCQAVVAPKVAKFRKQFVDQLNR